MTDINNTFSLCDAVWRVAAMDLKDVHGSLVLGLA